MSELAWDDDRMLCPDGACVGVIGPDGTCKVCGRAAQNWGDERKRGLIDPPDDEDDDEDDDADDAGDDLDDVSGDDGLAAHGDGDGESRDAGADHDADADLDDDADAARVV